MKSLTSFLLEAKSKLNHPVLFASIGNHGNIQESFESDFHRQTREVSYPDSKSELYFKHDYGNETDPDRIHNIHKKLSRHYDTLYKMNAMGLPHTAVSDYTKASASINTHLHRLNKMHDEVGMSLEKRDSLSHIQNDGTRKHVEHMDLFTRHLQPTPQSLTLFSGVRRNPGTEAAKHPERHVLFPAFTSTSLDPGIAKNFASKRDRHIAQDPSDEKNEHVLRIHHPSGSGGFYNTHVTYHDDEYEHILPRNTVMRIARRPMVESRKLAGGTMKHLHIWDAEPILGHEFKRPLTEAFLHNNLDGYKEKTDEYDGEKGMSVASRGDDSQRQNAAHYSTDSKVLHHLSMDDNEYVRRNVAGNKNASISTRFRLRKDKSAHVSGIAKKAGLF